MHRTLPSNGTKLQLRSTLHACISTSLVQHPVLFLHGCGQLICPANSQQPSWLLLCPILTSVYCY
jgi:hypothetical protein